MIGVMEVQMPCKLDRDALSGMILATSSGMLVELCPI